MGWLELEMEKTSIRTKEYAILKQLRRRFTKGFLDLIILAKLSSGDYINGYALIEYIHQKYRIFLSSGTVYSTLYAMERNGLIKGVWKERGRFYHITPEGKEVIQIVAEKIDNIKFLFGQFELTDKKREQEIAIQ